MAITEKRVAAIARREAKEVMAKLNPKAKKKKRAATKVKKGWKPSRAAKTRMASAVKARKKAAAKPKANPGNIALPTKIGQTKSFTAHGETLIVKKRGVAHYYLRLKSSKRGMTLGGSQAVKEAVEDFLAHGGAGLKSNPQPKAAPKKGSVRITKLKAGGYSISGKDKAGKAIKMRSEKKSTANAVKRLVVDKGYTVTQLRKLEKSAKALRPFVKNPGKVWFPKAPKKATKVRKKTKVQLKKKPVKAKKNPAKKKKSYAKVTKIFKALVAHISKRTPKTKDALSRVGLAVKKDIHDTPRHYGIYVPSQKLVGVAPEITDLPLGAIRGVLLHELGHALIDMGVYAKPKARGYYATERRADVVAKAASGLTIYYDKNHIQRAGAGSKGLKVRPKSLR